MTIKAMSRLFGQLRSFVEVQLPGLLCWDDVIKIEPLKSEPVIGRYGVVRRNPEGPYKEIATVKFGDYDLTVSSPNAEPPLGWIRLECPGAEVQEGALDVTTWARIGEFIRNRGIDDGHRKSA